MFTNEFNSDSELASTLHELEKNQSNVDEITRVHARLPYSDAELESVVTVFKGWTQKGRTVGFDPTMIAGTLESDQNIASSDLHSAFQKGLLPITLPVVGAEVLIVKANAGKGFFGGQKTKYVCFVSGGDRQFLPAGEAKTLVGALTKTGMLFRA